jgi:phosphatidylglycerophosphatase A
MLSLTGFGVHGTVQVVRNPLSSRTTNWLIQLAATGFLVGKIRIMPGTFGTLWGLPLVWFLAQGGPVFYMVAAVLLLFVSAVIADLYEQVTSSHDPGEVVIDEVVGYVIAMTWMPLTWQAFAAAFLLFRFFDILKPYPISLIDRRVPGGLGTILDDVAAGLVANVILQFVLATTQWLGGGASLI